MQGPTKLPSRLLVKVGKARGMPMRQSYLGVDKCAPNMPGRFAHARQVKRVKCEQKKVKTIWAWFVAIFFEEFL